MKTMLVTGAGPNGITGKLVCAYFPEKYTILSPSSMELDLADPDLVSRYFTEHTIDYVVHCATFRSATARSDCFAHDLLESNLRMYFNLAAQSHRFEKMIFWGSGAEFDKSRSIQEVTEDQFGVYIPKDCYGFSKYLMNLHALKSSKIVNLRLFGTINPLERPNKNVISNLCVKALKGMPLTLTQDRKFSFIYMADAMRALDIVLEGNTQYHDYNLVSSECCFLSQIAAYVASLGGGGPGSMETEVSFMKCGLNSEYTASNKRLVGEFNVEFTPIQEAIRSVYEHYRSMIDDISLVGIDDRWGK